MRTLDALVLEAPVFRDLDTRFTDQLAGCARTDGFAAGDLVFRESEPANTFWILRQGRVALELHTPNRGSLLIETLDPGEVLGWSWLFPPFRWHFDARALTNVRAVAVDGACLRGKCDADPAFGYELMRRFSQVMVERLQATRVRLLDLYGSPGDR
ncbi:MAG: cyclic nucleotide-binding domain-containing protein [Gaiellaceae bacterium]